MSRGSSTLSRLHNIFGMGPGGFGVLTGDFGMGCVGFRFGEKGIGKRLKVSRMRNDAVLAVPECVLGGPDAVTVHPEWERAVPESERAVPECERVVPEPKRAVPECKRAVPDAVEGTPPSFPHNQHGMSGLHALEKGQTEAFSAQAMAKVLSAMLSGVKLNLAGAIPRNVRMWIASPDASDESERGFPKPRGHASGNRTSSRWIGTNGALESPAPIRFPRFLYRSSGESTTFHRTDLFRKYP